MARMKELWFAEMERKFNELVDEGYPEEKAYDIACNTAWDDLCDKMAYAADRERDRQKEERLFNGESNAEGK